MASRYCSAVSGGEQRDFQLAANGGERRAQLVRHVGRKLADLLEGILSRVGHAVEAVDQIIQFVAGAAQRNLQGKIRAGDLLRRLRDLVHRLDRAARQRPAEQAGQRNNRQQR